ncbi:MAG: hypothetical protein PWP51_2436 [Clostridiales bacterium]|nr:hypothetical protein [Clostridiales bacterium]
MIVHPIHVILAILGVRMDFRKRREQLLTEPIGKVLITLAVPVMINNLIQTFYDLTDTYFVGRIGGNEVAAISLVWPILFLMISFGVGMSMAGATLIAQYIGNGNEKQSRHIAGQIISFLMFIAIIIGIAGYYLTPSIVYWMGARNSLFTNASTYLRIMFAGLPAMFMMFAFNAIKQGQGDNISPMIFGAISVGINVVLDPIFIFALNQGIAGAARATVLARVVVGTLSVMTLFSTRHQLTLQLRDLVPRMDQIIKICRLGIPSSFGQAMQAFGFTILNVFLVGFGEVTLTAFAIGNRVNALIIMPTMGIGNALSTVVGQNLGADNTARAKEAVKRSVIISTITLVIGGMMIYPLSDRLIGVFTQNPEVIFHGGNYLRLIMLSAPLMGFFQILNGTFQGSGHTVYSMILMMGRLWGLRLPMIVALSHTPSFGPNSVWYAMIASNFIICCIGWGIYFTGRWQRKVIKDVRTAVEL